jgi:hypothetical protein
MHFRSAAIVVLFCVAMSDPAGARARATEGPKDVRFSLRQGEVARGKAVTVSWSFTGRVRALSLHASALVVDSIWPLQPRNVGSFTFVVTDSVAPTGYGKVTLVADGVAVAGADLYVSCAPAWFFAPRMRDCPSEKARGTPAAVQRFEHGRMFWIGADKGIVVLLDAIPPATAGEYHWFRDDFIEGSQETDPAFVPPRGLLQPKRGFGKLWRANSLVQSGLGWALEPERGFASCTQVGYYPGGNRTTAYFTDQDRSLYEVSTEIGSVGRWRAVRELGNTPVAIGRCE